jgi:hypothetical protein
MSAPNGYNQGGYGGPGNPYTQEYNPEGGNPYTQGGYPYAQNIDPLAPGYPPSGTGGYPLQSGGYPGQQPAYPSQGGYPGQQPAYPSQGGYPGSQQISGFGPNDPRTQRLNQIIQQYEINQQFGTRLHALGNCEVVVLCDDSGSMNTPLQGSTQTRWEELKFVCRNSILFFIKHFYVYV